MERLLGIFVPFQFDLGGPVAFDTQLLERLGGFGPWKISHARSRSFNTSYLLRHAPVLRVGLEPLRVEAVETRWEVARWLLIYPWLGTVSLNHHFRPAGRPPGPDRLLRFYDELVGLIDEDYLPYLFQHRQMENLGVQLTTEYRDHRPEPSRLQMGDTIDRLRRTLGPSVRSRPTTYWFMNFRMMYLWSLQANQTPDLSLVRALLDLRQAPASRSFGTGPDLVSEVADVWSNGWVTTVVVNSAHEDEQAATVDTVWEAFSLCHAQWFLCQIWISIYAEIIGGDEAEQKWTGAQVESFAQNLYALERDLAEAANLDVMLRDPLRIQLSYLFLDRLRLAQHLEDARRRLTLLTQFLRGQLEIQTSRAAARLQLLFSFSAAAAIAALVPPIWPLWPVKVLGWVVLLVSLSLLLAFAGPPAGIVRAFQPLRSKVRSRRER